MLHRSLIVVLICSSVAFALSGSAHPAPSGRFSLGAFTSYATGATPESYEIADLNADGKPDVVTANLEGKSVSILLNSAHGRFAPRHDYRLGGGAKSVVVAKLDENTTPDLVVLREGAAFSVLLNRGDGSFAVGQTAGFTPTVLSAADLNGDRRADVVTRHDDVVSVFINRGDGTFLPNRDYQVVGDDPQGLVVADLTGDHRPDIGTTYYTNVTVLLNDGHGSFGRMRRYKTPAQILVAKDLNRDGALDLVTADNPEDAMGAAFVLLNRGHGRFRTPRRYAIGTNLGTWTVADLNGDSAPDLIGQYEARVAIEFNRGNGIFQRRRDYATPWFFHFTVADVNGGSPDLVFASWDLGRVGVLLNRGHGKFGALLQYRTLDGPDTVRVADLNGDRSGDVLTLSNDTDGGGNRISVLLSKRGKCDVQDVFKKTLGSARATLMRGGCTLGRVTWGHSRVPPGRVMGQRPKFGAVLRGGSSVDIVVSRG